MSQPPFHPVAEIFPMMDEAALTELSADIRANGLREPIWRHQDGRIVDGRNRWLACQKAAVACADRTFGGSDDELVPFVISHNLHRRHLTESQRALVAGRIANWPSSGGGNTTVPLGTVVFTVDRAGELLNISNRTVKRGRKVLQSGVPELAEAVQSQKISINAAAEIAGHAPEEQRRRLSAHQERSAPDKRQKGTPKMRSSEEGSQQAISVRGKPKPPSAVPVPTPDHINYMSLWLRNGVRAIRNFRDHRECLEMFGLHRVQIDQGEVAAIAEFMAALCASMEADRAA